MPSGVIDSVLLENNWGTPEIRRIFCDENRVQKWLDVEVALAQVQAELGLIPAEAAAEIATKARVENIDLRRVAEGIAKTRHPLVPVLQELRRQCAPELGEYIHLGPTTQDIIDTGMVLQLREAHNVFLRDLRAVARSLYRLADQHRETVMAGRTHGIQALPTTFGLKCATWLQECGRHIQRMQEVEPRLFVGCLFGAVGTRASFEGKGAVIESLVMKRLGLGSPGLCWHSSRDRFCEYASILGLIAGTLAKIANEIFNLQRVEIGEVEEPFTVGKVGSSTMPHKRNPAVVENVITLGRSVRYQVGVMFECLIQEHERDSAAWKTEWKALPEICINVAAMLDQMNFVLKGLIVHADRMRRNLDLLGGHLLSERVMLALAPHLGKMTAHDVVYAASMRGQEQNRPLGECLLEDPRVAEVLSRADLEALLDPSTYVGDAPTLVANALAEAEAQGWV
ncbi:MAG TPA: adenylosuccinate lyase [Bacillota bacterium]